MRKKESLELLSGDVMQCEVSNEEVTRRASARSKGTLVLELQVFSEMK